MLGRNCRSIWPMACEEGWYLREDGVSWFGWKWNIWEVQVSMMGMLEPGIEGEKRWPAKVLVSISVLKEELTTIDVAGMLKESLA